MGSNFTGDRCFNCGIDLTAGNRSREHVIPKMFFPGGHVEDPITVPSCKPCNKGPQKDQELLLLFVLMQSSTHPIASRMWDLEVLPKLRRPHNWRLVSYLNSLLAEAELRTEGGIILRKVPIVMGPPERLFPVYQVIARGLYAHHYREYRLAGREIRIYYEFPREMQEIAQALILRDPWGGIFRYAIAKVDDDRSVAIFMRFFNARPILAVADFGDQLPAEQAADKAMGGPDG